MLQSARRLVDERDHLTELANTTADRAATEDRDLTDTERASLAQWQERCADIDAQLETHRVAIESQRSYARLRAAMDDPGDNPPAGRRSGAQGPVEVRSWGQTFVESDAFTEYGGRGTSEAVEMPGGLFEMRAPADPITVADLGRTIRPQVWEPPSPTYRNPFLEVMGRVPVSVGAVEYFYYKPIPPDPAPEVAEGAVKPPANIEIEEKAQALKTYAHWKAITRQALEDHARIRSIVEGKLRDGLFRSIENAAAAALMANADIPEIAGPANLLEGIRQGMADVETNGYVPNAVAVNPHDWAEMDISILAATFNGPVVGRAFWGLTPVPVPALPSGTSFVGDFRDGLTYFDRNVTQVMATDSHADYFIRNLLVILAETRGLAVVTEPAALAKVTV
jgi:hypothetical protein